ncbi:hypothetical protein KPL78_27120 [Roseomonas sp. HJA6]|uniref:Uncharacterized protein n=1 Tax=Roseomonas alba TaxID=2846776 RepID=A0ABS7AIK1_9PROT|nr:hypothetical protein [Neoroseomonas alba]MBW6401552.1 hypothetical protein [Neoroseomonas alba]
MRHLAVALLLAVAIAAPAGAQVMYNGWNIGPDYGAMVDQVNRDRAAQMQQMQQGEQWVIQQAMQDPICQQYYAQHRAQGGQTPWPAFAYQCAATGRFSREGMQAFRDNESRNQRAEQDRYRALQDAERQRGMAQGQWADGYGRNQAEMGRVMQGQQTWTDPRTGQQQVLPYTGGAITRDPATGRVYGRDASGQQYVQGSDGLWYALRPGW